MAPYLFNSSRISPRSPGTATSPLEVHLPASPLEIGHPCAPSAASQSHSNTLPSPSKRAIIDPDPPSRRRQKRSRKSCIASKPVYMCSSCNTVCKYPEEIKDDEDNSVQCDICKNWFHWGCTGFSVHNDGDEWICLGCE